MTDELIRIDEPDSGDQRTVMLGWLAFHRNGMAVKCHGLRPDQLVAASAPPSTLTLLGLVRHLTEMERVYAVHPLGPAGPLEFVFGDYVDGGPEWDFDVDESMVDDSFAAWRREQRVADAHIEQHHDLSAATNNRRNVGWNLQKLVGEYARHLGHADVLRERIDGATGE